LQREGYDEVLKISHSANHLSNGACVTLRPNPLKHSLRLFIVWSVLLFPIGCYKPDKIDWGLLLLAAITAAAIMVLIESYFRKLVYEERHKLTAYRHRALEVASNAAIERKKRLGLIRQLVNVAAEYAGHEKTILTSLAANSTTTATAAITFIHQASLKYPELTASQSYRQLSADLKTIEDSLQQKIEQYNEAVREFNVERSKVSLWVQSHSKLLNQFPEMSYDHAFEDETPVRTSA
jgi:hypothetical protein